MARVGRPRRASPPTSRPRATLDLDVVVSAHGPVLRGTRIDERSARTLDLAGQPPAPQPGQELLDDLLAPPSAPRPEGDDDMGTLIRNARVEATSTAAPDAVWAIVGDVTRTGEWSHECKHVDLLDGATAAEAGARFRGRNVCGRSRWSRVNEVLSVDRAERTRLANGADVAVPEDAGARALRLRPPEPLLRRAPVRRRGQRRPQARDARRRPAARGEPPRGRLLRHAQVDRGDRAAAPERGPEHRRLPRRHARRHAHAAGRTRS